MAKVSLVTITSVDPSQYYAGLQSGDRFISSRVVKKNVLLPRRSVAQLRNKTLLPELAGMWAVLSDVEQAAWKTAAVGQFTNGYRLFVQDTSIRLKNGLSGVVTPTSVYRSWIGRINITAPATEAQIVQYHPASYYVLRKVAGKQSQYSPVLVQESFSLPLYIQLSVKSILTSTGAGSFARFYAHVWHSYQGVDLYTDLVIDIPLSHDWQVLSAELTDVLGHVIAYDGYFHLYNVQGDLLFDNIEFEHDGQNWARDPFCDDIQEGFTRAFYQVPAHWVALILPDTADFYSTYNDLV
jgi:hypothetical protein